MALLPKRLITRVREADGVQYALQRTRMAYNLGVNPVVISGEGKVQFCKEVEGQLKSNFPITQVRGNLNEITVYFNVK